jgi:hypothetical protein
MVKNKVKQTFHSSLVNKIKYNNIHSLLLNINGKITLKLYMCNNLYLVPNMLKKSIKIILFTDLLLFFHFITK